MTRNQFIRTLQNILQYHRICGIERYPYNEELLKGLNRLEGSGPAKSPKEASGREKRETPPGRQAPIAPPAAQQLTELQEYIAACRNCELHATRAIDTAGAGDLSAKLLVVGDWLVQQDDAPVKRGVLFGADQDAMLERMLNAINLALRSVFVTNAIKCSVPATNRPTEQQVTICGTYLRQQIALINPLLICSMGTTASHLLLGSRRPLSQMRGSVHLYRCTTGREIPVVPTYHPTFLLQNPEMKKATWSDLQLVQKELEERLRAHSGRG